jgi:hypothetical protein
LYLGVRSVSGSTLTWTLGGKGKEDTLDRYTVFVSSDGSNLMPLGDVPTGTHSFDLSKIGLTAGTQYQLFVKATGKASLHNQMFRLHQADPAVVLDSARPAPPQSLSNTADPSRCYDLAVMAKKETMLEVACPCCAAVLKVDAATGSVISHTPPPRVKTFNDFEEAARAMKEQEGRKESLFRQSVEAEKNKASLLEKKFQEAVKRAREAPDEPRVRDIDLD